MNLPDKEAVLLGLAALLGAIVFSYVNRGSITYLPPTPPESLYQGTPLGYRELPLESYKGDDDDSSQTTEP